MVAVDESEFASNAFDKAVEFAGEGDSVFVMTVSDDSILEQLKTRLDKDKLAERKQAREKHVEEYHSKLVERVRATGALAESLNVWGSPREQLLSAVNDNQIDVVVVGSRGLGKLKRLVLGSTSDFLVHNARCDVLVIKS